jgi:hypothetical protein
MRYVKIYLLLTIYLFSCISLVIDFHYCGGELESVALYQADESDCCGEHEGEKKDCCQDKFVVVDCDDNEQGKQYIVKKFETVKTGGHHSPAIVKIVDNGLVLDKMVIPINHAPPDKSSVPLFIKNRILLI